MSLEHIPTGLAKELGENKETLPAIEVKNKVVWVNPDLDLPFRLQEGEATDLGLFLKSQPRKIISFFSPSVEEKSKNLEVEAIHHRSALLGRVVFGEKKRENVEQRLYRDVDIKGLGYVFDNLKIGKISKKNSSESTGILNLVDAQKDAGLAETFHDLGIRVHRAIAIVLLKEIISKGKKFSIKDAKRKGLISQNAKPALEIRAFGTHARLADADSVFGYDFFQKTDLFIEDARALIAQELGKNLKEFSRLEYADWLARTIGKNLGLMHKHKYIHGYLGQGHNITLDGCFVDFDSVQSPSPDSISDGFIVDDYGAKKALKTFFVLGMAFDEFTSEFLLEEYKNSYNAARDS